MTALTAGFLLLGCLAASAGPPGQSPLPETGAAPPPRPPVRRGPIESRDEFLLAQGRLTLPATSPAPLARGSTRMRVAADWGNDFGIRMGSVGGHRRMLYFVDGEHVSGSLQVSHGLTDRLALHARVPVLWRGGGVLDGLIDTWHRLTGLPDGSRPSFPRDRLLVLAVDRMEGEVAWPAHQGSGLGGLELGGRWSTRAAEAGWTAALDARVQLPTGTSSFEGGGVQVGAQALAARTLGQAGDVYLGFGATLAPAADQYAMDYAAVRPQGFVAFEWRPWPAVSVLTEMTAAGRLVENVEGFPGLHLILRMGAKVDVARGWRLEGGFTEGLKPVAATTDFGVTVGVERSF